MRPLSSVIVHSQLLIELYKTLLILSLLSSNLIWGGDCQVIQFFEYPNIDRQIRICYGQREVLYKMSHVSMI